MDVTILNGRKHTMKHSKETRLARRTARRNPDGGSLVSQAGSALLLTAIAAPVAVAIDTVVSGLKKGGTGADKDMPRYTVNQGAGLTLLAGAVAGVGLHIKGYAPRAGLAILAGCASLSAAKVWRARKLAQAQSQQNSTSDFTLSITPASETITLGTGDQFRDFRIAVVQKNPAAQITPVRIEVIGLSQGLTAQITPETATSAAPATVRVSVPATGAITAGSVAFAVRGTNASGTVTANASLVINGARSAGPMGLAPGMMNYRTPGFGAPKRRDQTPWVEYVQEGRQGVPGGSHVFDNAFRGPGTFRGTVAPPTFVAPGTQAFQPAGAAVGCCGGGAVNNDGSMVEEQIHGEAPHIISALTSQRDIHFPPGTTVRARPLFVGGSTPAQ